MSLTEGKQRLSARQGIGEELRRNPLTVCSTLAGVLVAAIGVFLAWLQLRAASPPVPLPPIASLEDKVGASPASILLVVGVFFALTISAASASRLLYRISGYAAFLTSIPLASFTILLSSLTAKWVGFDPSKGEAGAALSNLAFWGTLILYLACAGRPAIRDFIAGPAGADPDRDASSPGSDFGAVVIMIAIWGGVLSVSQRWLMAAFL